MSSSAKILVVDGDPSTRLILRLVLQNAHPDATIKEIDAAVPFAEAWAEGPWHVALYDPGTSPWAEGGRLVTALKRHDPGINVVVLSAGLDGDGVAELFRAGADDVLEKTSESLVEIPGKLEASLTHSSSRPESDLGEPTLETFVDEQELLETEMPRPSRPSSPPEPGRSPDPRSMVHDLKEPLRTINMLLEQCDRRHRDELPSEARGLIQWAQRSAQQLSADLDEIHAELAGSEETSGPSSVDVNDALADALRHLDALKEDTSAHVTTVDLPRVQVPPSAVRRILENLLANAMRHRGKHAPRIHVGVRVLDTEAVFSVRDNGPGIPDALRHRIFESGVRGEDGGAGLGLHGTRRLVERWGGQIWFDTVRGEGTTFYFSLPVAVPRRPSRSKN